MEDGLQYLGGGPNEYACYIFWVIDQRRSITVRGIDEVLPDVTVAAEVARRCVDELLPDDVMLRLSDDGKTITSSNNIEDDFGRFFLYPPWNDQPDDVKLETINRSELREEKRMYSLADIVSHVNGDDPKHLAVFKIAVYESQVRWTWNEAHIMRGLKGHLSIIPFEKFVVDDAENRLVGWTSSFIPGGTLEDNHVHTDFRLSWLTQITQIVDDINLKYGIMHRDIAARNFLIDPQMKRLLLFDCNNGIQIGNNPVKNPHFDGPPDVDGVIFTIYELLTFDKSFRDSKVFYRHEVSPIEQMKDWAVKAKLEPGLDVATIRRHLDRWVDERRTRRSIKHCTEATHPISLPTLPETVEPQWQDEDGETHSIAWQGKAREHGVHFVSWLRPPLQRVPIEYYIRALSLSNQDEASMPGKGGAMKFEKRKSSGKRIALGP